MTVAVIVATAMARDRPARPARVTRRDGASDGDEGGRATSAAGPAGSAASATSTGSATSAAGRDAAASAVPASTASAGTGPAGTGTAGTGTAGTGTAGTATAAQPAAALPCPILRSGLATTEPLLGRLCGQLARLGIHDVVLIAPPGFGGRLRDIAWEGISHAGTAPAAAENTASVDVIECTDVAAQLRAVAGVSDGDGDQREALLICGGDVIAHTDALALVAGATRTAALAEPPDAPGAALFAAGPDLRPALRTAGGAVAAAGSAFHRVTAPDAVGCGVFLVSPGDRDALSDVAEQLATVTEKADAEQAAEAASSTDSATQAGAADGRRPSRRSGAFGDAVALLLVGLVRGGVTVAALGADPLRCVRAATVQQARAAAGQLHTAPVDRLRMNAAVKAGDGFVATFLVSPYSRYIARWAASRRVSPHAVTGASAGLGLLAAVWFSAGTRAGLILGAVFLFGTFALDCVDGQLARYTRESSVLGSWLDPVSDRAKEYAAYAGLAVGGTAMHQPGVWGLALAAMIVQAIRYTIDLSYRLAGPAAPRPEPRRAPSWEALRAVRALPLDEPADYAVPPPDAGAPPKAGHSGPLRLARLSWQAIRRVAAGTGAALRWLARILYLPLGERFLVIAITAAVAGPRITFLVLLGWGTAAAVVTIAVRIARSLARGSHGAQRPQSPPSRQSLSREPVPSPSVASYRDDGIIAQWLGRLVAGQLPPLLPAIAGLTVTVALGAAGLHYGGIMAIAPVAAMLLAGLGSAHRHDGRLDWLVPPLLRVGEYVYIAAVGIATGVPRPIIFALIGAIVLHHYDAACRDRLDETAAQRVAPDTGAGGARGLRSPVYGTAPPPWVARAGLGWDGRMLFIALGAMLGVAPFAFTAASAYLWIFFGWESLTSWLVAPRDHLLAVTQVVDLEDGGRW
jgi:phosphatidylglycerophosphate synthase